jgi:hypothetical protein
MQGVVVTVVVVTVVVVLAVVTAVDGPAADGTEEAITGEGPAITRTEDTPITVIPTILTDIGQLSVILTAGATGFGFDSSEIARRGRGTRRDSRGHENDRTSYGTTPIAGVALATLF